MKAKCTLFSAAAIALACLVTSAHANVYSLNVVGLLEKDGVPANGFFDIDALIVGERSGGTVLASDTNSMVAVSNGVANLLFENLSNLSSVSATQDLYIQLAVRDAGDTNGFTVLGPRHRLVPSLFAGNAVRAEEARTLTEPLPATLLPASVASLTFTSEPVFGATSGPPFVVFSSAPVGGLNADLLDGYDSSDFWKLKGNGGTSAGVDFLGTTDNQPLELKVNSTRALRLEPNLISPNVIAGNGANAVIGTGGASILGGNLNSIDTNSAYSVIAGGIDNHVAADAEMSTISGGQHNLIQPLSKNSTISGGSTNMILAAAYFATIGGGELNSIYSGQGTIAGGHQNTIREVADYSTIGGGEFNLINPNSTGGTVGGGISNTVDQAAVYGTVSGGYNNMVGRGSSVIGGGESNFVAAFGASIGGGVGNQIQLDAKGSVVGGGAGNLVAETATNGVIAGGLGNVIHTNANFSAIGGGLHNHIGSSAPFATIPGGREAKAFNYGQQAYASGGFAGQEGTAQGSVYVLRGVTTDTNSTELFLNGSSERIHVPAGSTWAYDILVTARSGGAGSAGFQIRGMLGYNGAGNLVALGTPITNKFYGGGSITASVVADDVDKALTIVVQWGAGVAPGSVRWVASVRTAEVVFP